MVQAGLPSRYRVLEEVGQGGMAVVYRAEDEMLRREVAIKVLHAHLLAEPDSKARLEREAQAVAKLHHDNILQIFDYSGGNSAASYIVTEFIDGLTLKQALAARKPPLPEVAALIAIEIGLALAHAHSLGIIHRDVKPENVMVRKDGILKLMDFGVAQILDLERMTVTGQLLGSPAYMAPELFDGKPLDVRTDVFSVGIMLYQMATGALPFTGRNPHEVLKRIAEGRFADPRTLNRLVADRLARVISKALAKKPDDRYPTVAALVADLRAYVADAGLENAREEVRLFFTDPEGYDKALPGRIVAGLVATGQREQAARKLARALECWNRALALDPRNEVVLRSLNRIEGRRRLHRTAVVLGGTALLGGLIWASFKLAREDVPAQVSRVIDVGGQAQARKAAAKATPVTTQPALATAPTATSDGNGHGNAHRTGKNVLALRKGTAGRRDKGAGAVNGPRTFIVAPKPKWVAVYLDDQKVIDTDVGKDKVIVPWDRVHKLRFVNEGCCEPLEFELGPGKSHPMVDLENNRITATLDLRPTSVTVNLKPPRPDADIIITEVTDKPRPWKNTTKHGDKVPMPFEAAGDLKKTVEVMVFASGSDQLLAKRTIEVFAGRNNPIDVTLE
jgi:tRNA A-37 threonylcarbamoyl transferase component Bud32